MAVTRCIFAIIAPVALLALGGCASHSDPQAQTVDADTWRSPHPQSVDVTSTVTARQGRPPIALLLQSPAMVRVVDATTGQQVASAPGSQGQIVSVDADEGVHIGGQSLSGPLPGDHEYSIRLDFQAADEKPARSSGNMRSPLPPTGQAGS